MKTFTTTPTINLFRIVYTGIISILFMVSLSPALELKTRTVSHPDFDITINGEIVEKGN